MKREFTCIVCPNGCRLHTEVENGAVTSVTGNRCPKGRDFAEKECTAPTRSLCTTVKTLGGGAPVLPVRTAGELPKERLFEAMAVLNAYTQTVPVYCGDVLIPDLLGTGCAVIATDDWAPEAAELKKTCECVLRSKKVQRGNSLPFHPT